MRRQVFWAIGCFSVLLAFKATGESLLPSDSGVNGPTYDEVLSNLNELAKSWPQLVQTSDYGKTPEGRPMRALKIAKAGVSSAAPRSAVLISGATHGNEYLGIEDKLPSWLLAHQKAYPHLVRYLDSGGVLFVIPIANPDGYTVNTRENSHGVDLNRDFDLVPVGESHFAEPETRELARWLDQELRDQNLKLRLTIDYHCCDGSLLFPWAHSEAAIPSEDQAQHEQIAKLMLADIDSEYVYGNTSTVLGYLGRGTSKDYYYAKYHALAFTFEGAYEGEGKHLQKHALWLDHVLETLEKSGNAGARVATRPLLRARIAH